MESTLNGGFFFTWILHRVLLSPTNYLLEYEIMRYNESINDKNLFKAVFMAGGPGSGKSFVANNMFGFNRSNISFSGAMLVNTDILFEIGLKKAGLPMIVDMSDEAMYERQMEIRQRAIQLTETRESYWINSMLPLIIDGTGKDFEKIKRQSDALRSYGYDTSMVFVNTTVETALKRNQMRPRSLDPNMVRKMWEMVQANIGKFQEYFGPSNFIIIDSNVNYEKGTEASDNFEEFLYKTGNKLLNAPLKNRVGIANIRYLKEHHGKYLSDLAQEDTSEEGSWRRNNFL